MLHVDGKVLSLHHRLIIGDPGGREAGQVHRKLAALRPTYAITVEGTDVAEVGKHLFIPMTARYAVEAAPGEDDVLILASVLALDLAIDADKIMRLVYTGHVPKQV